MCGGGISPSHGWSKNYVDQPQEISSSIERNSRNCDGPWTNQLTALSRLRSGTLWLTTVRFEFASCNCTIVLQIGGQSRDAQWSTVLVPAEPHCATMNDHAAQSGEPAWRSMLASKAAQTENDGKREPVEFSWMYALTSQAMSGLHVCGHQRRGPELIQKTWVSDGWAGQATSIQSGTTTSKNATKLSE